MASRAHFDPTEYWRRTLRRLLVLLAIWLLVGPILSIIAVEPLNRFSIGGVPFGFWMGQQGSIYVFVVLIFVNAWLADRLDREFDVHETPGTTRQIESAEH
jgi:putative solute:sodium symporter small subunit